MEPAAGTPGRGDASSGPRKAPSISPNICYFSELFGDGAHSGEIVKLDENSDLAKKMSVRELHVCSACLGRGICLACKGCKCIPGAGGNAWCTMHSAAGPACDVVFSGDSQRCSLCSGANTVLQRQGRQSGREGFGVPTTAEDKV
jgi:hypothetical protein